MVAEPTDVLVSASSDDVGAWIAALEGKIAIEDNLNAPNIGQIFRAAAGRHRGRGVLDGAGYHPRPAPCRPVDRGARIVRPHVLREELTIEAALEEALSKALAVLASDPLLVRPSARPMLEEDIAATRSWLPQFRA